MPVAVTTPCDLLVARDVQYIVPLGQSSAYIGLFPLSVTASGSYRLWACCSLIFYDSLTTCYHDQQQFYLSTSVIPSRWAITLYLIRLSSSSPSFISTSFSSSRCHPSPPHSSESLQNGLVSLNGLVSPTSSRLFKSSLQHRLISSNRLVSSTSSHLFNDILSLQHHPVSSTSSRLISSSSSCPGPTRALSRLIFILVSQAYPGTFSSHLHLCVPGLPGHCLVSSSSSCPGPTRALSHLVLCLPGLLLDIELLYLPGPPG